MTGDRAGERRGGVEILQAQQQHWARAFAENPDMYGTDPSDAAVMAAGRSASTGARNVLELGAGQGRDSLFLAREGFDVVALDYAEGTLETIAAKASAADLTDRVSGVRHNVRDPLPFSDETFDACYSHMLFCMALTTPELEQLVTEVRRVVRPGGTVVYTVRHTGDAHCRRGIPRGDGMFEHGGFIVHFFDWQLVEQLANGFEIVDVADFNEGDLPRRLWRVTMRKPADRTGSDT